MKGNLQILQMLYCFPFVSISQVFTPSLTSIYELSFSPHTEPDVIKNLAVNNITTSSAFLTWNGLHGIRSFFKVQWTDDKTNETSNTSYHITGLTAGVNYTFCITAVAADQSTEGKTVCISQFTSKQNYACFLLQSTFKLLDFHGRLFMAMKGNCAVLIYSSCQQ